MTYRETVEFLEDSNPALIDRNAAEFRRLHNLIDCTDDAFRKAAKVEWESEARDLYVKRLREGKDLADALSEAFRLAGTALAFYADAVATAKNHYAGGKRTESKLVEVMSREATAITPTARAAEPLRQWEDLRGTTGVLDFFAEVTVDLDDIREEAEGYYNETKGHYSDALRVESEAREKCVADLKTAYRSIPDFRGSVPDPDQFLKNLGPLRAEAQQARDNPYVQLPGAGPKVDSIPAVGDDVLVSSALYRIQTRVAGLPEGQGNNYWLPSSSDEGRRDYISGNKELIKAAARDSGLPAEMVAGIAWQEVEGDPGWLDDFAYGGRKVIPSTDDPDLTSMGPMAIQVRRAAEVLGYDPHNLTDMQRGVIVDAIKDPAQNTFIASEYLAQLKAESAFADVPPDQMTRAQMWELAARYNGGPYYESDAAQAYGRGFDSKLDNAKEALR
ncbi:lytic transglycosylase domain-containing protein [Streptomyces sp. A3M-1-3]|uniref:lytic transglycosylase domain-containing protein n=1 Tax=Streptomyces sp. A3M-1-3 TaxID=2962044 RepID=UPI0020B77DB1|nr:lytic transglycosylase domain-containing protein [Streptomyces sp. A3M-1-3]MCP3819856.1 lytic transglycosylase domain-containing protein [Streptomyces sp. A3M-1-3]